jgi:hypothetical protein
MLSRFYGVGSRNMQQKLFASLSDYKIGFRKWGKEEGELI